MATSYEQLERFFGACDKFMNEKYIVADAKIAEILKSIASCRALTDLFSAVTERFDYPAAKKAYLKFPATVGSSHGVAYLPKDRGEVLAFVFCLLVDIDSGRLKFDDFLLRYFYEDGSYTASFSLFSERMIRPFREIVRECFPDVNRRDTMFSYMRQQNEIMEAIARNAVQERARLATLPLRAADAAGGNEILNELIAAAGKNYTSEVKALLTGYRYFLRSFSFDGAEEMFRLGEALE